MSLSNSPLYDVLIRGTEIVDGTGKAAFKGDIAIKGEKIVAVGKVKGNALIEITGSGLVASPGFIDPHSHADQNILQFPLAENFIMQGVTTFLGGNCGGSPAPKKGLSFGEWLLKVEESGISINIAMLVGHNTVRRLVMGKNFRRKATSAEIEEMKKYIEEAMESGAFGFSVGLDPGIGHFADAEEILEMAKVAQKYNGLYVPHTRHVQSQWPTDDPEEVSYGRYYGPPEDVWVGKYRGYLEALEISRKAKIPLHIAHLGTAYIFPQPHPDFLEEAAAKATLVEIIDKARDEGLEITFDDIPTTIGGQSPVIEEFLKPGMEYPDWLKKLKREELVEKLKTKEFRDKVRKVYDSCRIKFGMIHTKADPYWFNCFKITTSKNKEYEGRTIGEIAHMRNTDALETIFDILVEDPEITWVQFLDRRKTPTAILIYLKHPAGMPSIDTQCYPVELESDGSEQPSPNAYGLFPYYINLVVKEKDIMSLEEAVMHATSLPAQFFGLKNRGILTAGAYADIVVFDSRKIKMAGNFKKPNIPPEGIEYVLINGKIVYKGKEHTGEKPGKVIKH